MKNTESFSTPSVLTIIVTYNGELWIRKCLSSLATCTLPSTVLVVDNGSTDRTVEIITSEFPDVILIRSKDNLGFGRANNAGIEYGVANKFDFFFLLNQDAWIEQGTIEPLVKVLQNYPGFGIVSPLHLNGEGTLLDYKFFDYIFESSQRKLVSDFFFRHTDEVYPVKFINAAAWLLSADCIKKVGGFDPLFLHYGEDVNYVNRLDPKGFKLGVVPGSKIFHDREARAARAKKSFDTIMEYRRLLMKYTDPKTTFNLLSFLKENLRLIYKAVKSLCLLRFERSKNYLQLLVKFSLCFTAIKKSKSIYLTEYSFLNIHK